MRLRVAAPAWNGGKDRRRGVTVSDRFFAGFLQWAMARPSSSASIHRGPVLTGRRGSGRRDWVPADHVRGGSAFGTPDTSTVDSTHSVKTDDRRAGVGSCPGWSNRLAASSRRNPGHFAAAVSILLSDEVSVRITRSTQSSDSREFQMERVTLEAIANPPQLRSSFRARSLKCNGPRSAHEGSSTPRSATAYRSGARIPHRPDGRKS